MKDQIQEEKLQQLFFKYAENEHLSLEQTLQVFSELNYIPSMKDSQLIFNALKQTDKLTYQEFKFWWYDLRGVSSQEYLIKTYVKIFKTNRKFKELLIQKKEQNQSYVNDNYQGVLIRAGFGEVTEKEKNQIKFRVNVKNGFNSIQKENKIPLRTLLELDEKDLVFVAQIQLSSNIDLEKCAKDFQQLLKSCITVGTSLHKGTKQLLSKISIQTKIAKGNAYIIAKLDKSVESIIKNIIQTVQEYLVSIQPEEEIEIRLLMQNDLLSILQAYKKKIFSQIINNSEIKISTFTCRFFSAIADFKELEKLNIPQFQLIFSLLTLLKTLKFDLKFKNLSESDSWLEQYLYLLPESGYDKVHLPNMNIIKKVKDFCFNYLESFFSLHFLGPNLKAKVQVSLPKLSSAIKECVEL